MRGGRRRSRPRNSDEWRTRTCRDRRPMLKALLGRERGESVDTSPTGLYAVGSRVVSAVVLAVGGILTLFLLDPQRIGVFLSVTALSAFTAVMDLGLAYSLLLAASSRRPEEA